jgi:hemoglobin/transferrin/lactoferrin receptor protein
MSSRLSLFAAVMATTALTPLLPGGALAQTAEEAPGTTAPAASPVETTDTATPVLPPATLPFITLDEIVVSATRNPVTLFDAPVTISAIGAQQIEDRIVTNIQSLVRYEPGVSVGRDGTDTGITSYVIRGIGGNRVMVQTDGLDLPDFEQFGHTYNRDFVDVDTIKRVEILRGPGSALFGSDAVGGVVSYFTKDPADYLDAFGRDVFVSGKFAYDSASETFSETGTVAIRAGDAEMLGVLVRRDGQEIQPNADVDPNPQDYAATSLLGKLVFHPNDVDTFRIIGEFRTSETDSDLNTDLSDSVLSSTSEDSFSRWRLSVEQEHDAPLGFIDSFLWRVGVQHLERNDHLDQRRTYSYAGPYTYCNFASPIFVPGYCDLATDYDFHQTILSAELQLNSSFTLFDDVVNRLTYGVEVTAIDASQPRDRVGTYVATNPGGLPNDGDTTQTIGGESYPGKYFPDSTTLKIGGYIQDEITVGDTGLTFYPAVRFDYYGLSLSPDEAFERSSDGAEVEDKSWFSVSPKIGVVYDVTDALSLYGQYAHGFRAPPYYEANAGFTNALYGYEIIPTTDLEPETSDNFEIGVRGNFSGGSSFTLSTFYSVYRNFLSAVQISEPPETPLIEFQYQNLPKVEIWGIEGTATVVLDYGFSAMASFSWAEGTDVETGDPVNDVDPLKLVGGLRWDDAELGLGIEFTGTYYAAHDRVTEGTFVTPESTVFDLTARWDVTPNITIAGGIYNITDEKYWNPQDAVWGGLTTDDATADLLAQPGRNVAVSATLRW